LNDSSSPEASRQLHRACLSLGSNIEPTANIPRAVALLRQACKVEAISSCWETQAVGSDGPDFINLAVLLATERNAQQLKTEVIAEIEAKLGRVRSQDKNAPRTIDLDIILFDGAQLDKNLWQRVFVALPVSELLPELLHPESGQSLREAALALNRQSPARLRTDLFL
jgi:2-amino-4-hydroxy-6-hydroxymethyldihydropteridine diphosphokinase